MWGKYGFLTGFSLNYVLDSYIALYLKFDYNNYERKIAITLGLSWSSQRKSKIVYTQLKANDFSKSQL